MGRFLKKNIVSFAPRDRIPIAPSTSPASFKYEMINRWIPDFYWAMDEASGALTESMTASNSTSTEGSPSYTATEIISWPGSISLTTASFAGLLSTWSATSFTVQMAFRLTSIPSQASLFHVGDFGQAGSRGWAVRVTTGGVPKITGWDAGAAAFRDAASGAATISPGIDYIMTIRLVANTSATFFLNEAKKDTISTNLTPEAAASREYRIGEETASNTGTNGMTGRIGHVALWAGSVSDNTILDMHTFALRPFG